MKLRGSTGSFQIGKLLGRGGEGAVYEVVGHPNRVAKIYHGRISSEKAAKIEIMAAMKNDQLGTFCSWPLDLLRGTTGSVCGLLMPKAPGLDMYFLYGPKSRKNHFPHADWRFLVLAAANTARAFAAVHDAGCVIGDVNQGAVRVSEKAIVQLIDCDSFQISAGGRNFLCEVGTPPFTPPELQRRQLCGIIRTRNHDNFGLAVLIFHLLFLGRHPFAGRFAGSGEMSLDRAISEFRFAYGHERSRWHMQPPPHVPAISIASVQVELLFERAFSPQGAADGTRPSAREWATALDVLGKHLTKCPANDTHYSLKDFHACPWCELETATGTILFGVPTGSRSAGWNSDVTALWARVAAVQPPGPAPAISRHGPVPPSPAVLSVKRAVGAKRMIASGALVTALLAVLLVAPELLLLWIIVGVFARRMINGIMSLDEERSIHRQALVTALDNWKRLEARWQTEASDKPFICLMSELEAKRIELQQLPSLRQKRYEELKKGVERRQREKFLEKYELEYAKIKGIGPSRKSVLQSYNIETAADVTLDRVIKVPGIGWVFAHELVNWRRSLEKKFKFDPSLGIDQGDIMALDRETAEKARKIRKSLSDGAEQLAHLRAKIVSQRSSLKPLIDQAGRDVAQAEANLRAIA